MFIYGNNNQLQMWPSATRLARAINRDLVGGTVVPHYSIECRHNSRRLGELYQCHGLDDWRWEHHGKRALPVVMMPDRPAQQRYFDAYLKQSLARWGVKPGKVVKYRSVRTLHKLLVTPQYADVPTIGVVFPFETRTALGTHGDRCMPRPRVVELAERAVRRHLSTQSSDCGRSHLDPGSWLVAHIRPMGHRSSDECARHWGTPAAGVACASGAQRTCCNFRVRSKAGRHTALSVEQVADAVVAQVQARSAKVVFLAAPPFVRQQAMDGVAAAVANRTSCCVVERMAWLQRALQALAHEPSADDLDGSLASNKHWGRLGYDDDVPEGWASKHAPCVEDDASVIEQAVAVVAGGFVGSAVSTWSTFVAAARLRLGRSVAWL